jgi:hypothetical protein
VQDHAGLPCLRPQDQSVHRGEHGAWAAWSPVLALPRSSASSVAGSGVVGALAAPPASSGWRVGSMRPV